MKNCKIITLLLVLSLTASLSAQDGLALMKTGHGARQTGIGEAVVSIANTVNGSHYNPASIRSINKFTASFGHTEYWDNIRLESGFFATPLTSNLNLHGGIRFASVDSLEARINPNEQPDSYFDFHDISVKTGITYNNSEKLAFGLSLGFFFEKNGRWNGSAFNADLGLQYQASEKIQLGAAATNLGSSFQLSSGGDIISNEISLPTRYSVGGNYQLDKFLTALDLVILDDELRVHVGAETQIHEMFEFRAGYMFNYDSKNLSVGTTFRKRNIKIDYAFVPYSNDLGSTHLFNFTFSI